MRDGNRKTVRFSVLRLSEAVEVTDKYNCSHEDDGSAAEDDVFLHLILFKKHMGTSFEDTVSHGNVSYKENGLRVSALPVLYSQEGTNAMSFP